jgi:hypothetical protein
MVGFRSPPLRSASLFRLSVVATRSEQRRLSQSKKALIFLLGSSKQKCQLKSMRNQLAFLVPPTGFGNYCSSGEDVFMLVCEYPLN